MRSSGFFASAHPARIASRAIRAASTISRTLPQHTPHGLHRWRDKPPENTARLCLSTPRTDCILVRLINSSTVNLCLSTPRTDCIPNCFMVRSRDFPLPQHTPYGLHRGVQRAAELSRPLPQHTPYGLHLIDLSSAWVDDLLCLSTPRTDCISKIAQMQCHKSTQYAVSW